MKVISIDNYHSYMGKLIDVRHPLDYEKKHDSRSINIYADKLIMNHKSLLNKNKTYYIVCSKGHLSKKVVHHLNYLGYDVIQVIND